MAPLETCPVLDRALLRIFAEPTSFDDENPIMDAQNPPGMRYAADCAWTDAPAAELAPILGEIYRSLPTPESFVIWYGWAPHAAAAGHGVLDAGQRLHRRLHDLGRRGRRRDDAGLGDHALPRVGALSARARISATPISPGVRRSSWPMPTSPNCGKLRDGLRPRSHVLRLLPTPRMQGERVRATLTECGGSCRVPSWRSGRHDLSVRKGDRQGPIRAEAQEPAVFVDALMMQPAQRHQICQICATAEAPPDDVMEFGLGEANTAPGDRTRRILAA